MIRYEPTADGAFEVVGQIEVGVATRRVALPLGPWFAEAPDPAGLAMAPVVALPDPTWVEIARAGALRAGGQPPVLLLPGDVPAIGGQCLVAIAEGVEVVLVPGGGADALLAARVLNGRAILALPLDDPAGTVAILATLDVDVHIPIPSIDGPPRDRIRDLLARAEPERLHHVVEVDPRPALEATGRTVDDATDGALAAAAAGVLAGRLAAGNRRWRAERA